MMNNCNCCDDNEIKITLEEESPITATIEDNDDIDVNFNNKLNIILTRKHNELENLDYEESGHTGFMPSKLSLLPDVSSSAENSRINIMANINDNPQKITVSELSKRIIRTVEGEIPSDIQVGQYVRIIKEENNNGD